MFEDDGTARTNLLTHLGFSLPVDEKETVQDDLSQEVNAIGLEDTVSDKVGHEGDKEATHFPIDNGEDFFKNILSPKADTPVSTAGNSFAVEGSTPSTQEVQEEAELVESSDPSFDDSVQRALVVGDYKGAVAQCISADKMADALVIAHVGGESLWESTHDQYLKMNRSPYLKVVYAMVNRDLLSLINTHPLKFWKETLALPYTTSVAENRWLIYDHPVEAGRDATEPEQRVIRSKRKSNCVESPNPNLVVMLESYVLQLLCV